MFDVESQNLDINSISNLKIAMFSIILYWIQNLKDSALLSTWFRKFKFDTEVVWSLRLANAYISKFTFHYLYLIWSKIFYGLWILFWRSRGGSWGTWMEIYWIIKMAEFFGSEGVHGGCRERWINHSITSSLMSFACSKFVAFAREHNLLPFQLC